jgi:hypothetical protein
MIEKKYIYIKIKTKSSIKEEQITMTKRKMTKG